MGGNYLAGWLMADLKGPFWAHFLLTGAPTTRINRNYYSNLRKIVHPEYYTRRFKID